MKKDLKYSKYYYVDIFGIVPETKFGSNKNFLKRIRASQICHELPMKEISAPP